MHLLMLPSRSFRLDKTHSVDNSSEKNTIEISQYTSPTTLEKRATYNLKYKGMNVNLTSSVAILRKKSLDLINLLLF